MPVTDRGDTLPAWALAHAPVVPNDTNILNGTPDFRPLPDEKWITQGEDAPGQAMERLRLLQERPDDVVAILPGAHAAIDELAEGITASAPLIRESGLPEMVARNADVDLAFQLARRSVEDWVIMTRDDESGAWCMTAGLVCFPAHWRLAEKIGKPMGAIHAPVPHYTADLSMRVNRVFDRLQPGAKRLGRSNWGIDDGHGLNAPPGAPAPWMHLGPFLRVENQSITKLPRSGAIAFGIRTFLTPLSRLEPREAKQLRDTLVDLPSRVRTYKMGQAVCQRALDRLKMRL